MTSNGANGIHSADTSPYKRRHGMEEETGRQIEDDSDGTTMSDMS
jgi:hypothetical protein